MLIRQGAEMENMDDSTTTAGRFAALRANARLSRKAFAESLGIHPVVAGDIELGKREPSREVLVRLAEVYGADLTWLLTGVRSAGPGVFAGTGATGRDGFLGDRGDDGLLVGIRFVRQEAAAGRGVEIDDYPESETLSVPRSFIAPRKSERVLALSVRGDSMTGIGLDDGDIVLFATDDRTGDGIHVVSIGSRLLVKRIHLDPAGRRVEIISENPRYGVRVLEGPELDEFRIEGRVIGSMHRY